MMGRDELDAPGYRIVLGTCVFLKWMRLLFSLRQLESVGLKILPILTTMWDVKPFVGVLSLYFIGSVNMLYALGLHSLENAFLIIYRLVVLGDMDLNEWENQSTLRLEADLSGQLVQVIPEGTSFRVASRMMMIFVSFVMGVSMMNLFVAMLCNSYADALQQAPMAVLRCRAKIVLDHQALKTGLRVLSCHTRQATGALPRDPSKDLTDGLSHIWFCKPDE
mmetsp:Transcript_105584/g.293983  ORF Transcript_105584/g.293983 Transcript_105584/m.293983 type:complete len:221 (-) Transcript_105584:138-800(-)